MNQTWENCEKPNFEPNFGPWIFMWILTLLLASNGSKLSFYPISKKKLMNKAL